MQTYSINIKVPDSLDYSQKIQVFRSAIAQLDWDLYAQKTFKDEGAVESELLYVKTYGDFIQINIHFNNIDGVIVVTLNGAQVHQNNFGDEIVLFSGSKTYGGLDLDDYIIEDGNNTDKTTLDYLKENDPVEYLRVMNDTRNKLNNNPLFQNAIKLGGTNEQLENFIGADNLSALGDDPYVYPELQGIYTDGQGNYLTEEELKNVALLGGSISAYSFVDWAFPLGNISSNVVSGLNAVADTVYTAGGSILGGAAGFISISSLLAHIPGINRNFQLSPYDDMALINQTASFQQQAKKLLETKTTATTESSNSNSSQKVNTQATAGTNTSANTNTGLVEGMKVAFENWITDLEKTLTTAFSSIQITPSADLANGIALNPAATIAEAIQTGISLKPGTELTNWTPAIAVSQALQDLFADGIGLTNIPAGIPMTFEDIKNEAGEIGIPWFANTNIEENFNLVLQKIKGEYEAGGVRTFELEAVQKKLAEYEADGVRTLEGKVADWQKKEYESIVNQGSGTMNKIQRDIAAWVNFHSITKADTFTDSSGNALDIPQGIIGALGAGGITELIHEFLKSVAVSNVIARAKGKAKQDDEDDNEDRDSIWSELIDIFLFKFIAPGTAPEGTVVEEARQKMLDVLNTLSTQGVSE